MKIDKRVNYRIVIDVETAPMDITLNSVTPQNMLVYDVGYAVIDKKGNVYKTESVLVKEIFIDEYTLMQSAYYKNKIPSYWEDVLMHKRQIKSLYEIRKALIEDIETFNVKEIYAHNMRFDYGALNNTIRWLTKSKYRYFFPKQLKICDTLKMSRSVIGNMATYKKFCEKNGYLTKRGQLRFTAEILTRYIKKDNAFVESHTGLEDVLIEKDILAYCYRQHKAMRKLLWE